MSKLHQIRVKICGIKDVKTARAAAALGADAIGMVFAPGKRRVTPETAREISLSLPPFVTRVGVFVDAPFREVRDMAEFCRLDVIQLHGSEPPDYCRYLQHRVIKAFRVGDGTTPDYIKNYPADAVLLDTFVPQTAGGTGRTFDWNIVPRLNIDRPFILAGGLTPENVWRAIEIAKPYGVDVSSGVETNGIKDLDKIEAFICQVKSAGREIHAAG